MGGEKGRGMVEIVKGTQKCSYMEGDMVGREK